MWHSFSKTLDIVDGKYAHKLLAQTPRDARSPAGPLQMNQMQKC